MEWSMNEPTDAGARRKIGRALGIVATALVLATATFQPEVAAAHGGGGGGGGHGGGGGFHGGGGGFHGGGFGGFHGGGFHGGGFYGGGFHRGFRGGFGFGGIYAPYWLDYGYPYYDYGYYGYPYDYGYYGYDPSYGYYGNYPNYYGNYPNYSQPAGQVWYYCSNPAGYYPYVTQCNTGWQTVPAS
jgi:hypothetical protein